jgi:hypothetical protein
MLVTFNKTIRRHVPRDSVKLRKPIFPSVDQLEPTFEKGPYTVRLIALYVIHLVSLLISELAIQSNSSSAGQSLTF